MLVCLGDLVGAGAWSRHARLHTENAERTRELANNFFEIFNTRVHRSIGRYWVQGNHEHRVERAHVEVGAGMPPWGLGAEGLVDTKLLERWHVRRYTDAPMELMDGTRRLLFFHGADGKGHIPTLRQYGYRGHVFQGHAHQLSAQMDGDCWSVRCGHLGPQRPSYIKGPAPSGWTRGYVVYERNVVTLRALF